MATATKPGHHDRLVTAVLATLRVLPAAGDSGYPSPGELAAQLAHFLRIRLSPMERLFLASATVLALDQDTRQALIEAAERDHQSDEWPFPGVDPELFRRVCREHRPPPLTQIEKLRAAQISFDSSPREALAAAWAGATDRDRRDLVSRATGRISA